MQQRPSTAKNKQFFFKKRHLDKSTYDFGDTGFVTCWLGQKWGSWYWRVTLSNTPPLWMESEQAPLSTIGVTNSQDTSWYKNNRLPLSRLKVKSLSHVRLFVTPWTVAHQASLSMGLSRQEYWSGLPFPSPGGLPDRGIEPRSPALQADALPSEPSVLISNCSLCNIYWG